MIQPDQDRGPKRSGHAVRDNQGVKVVKTIVVNQPVGDLYRFWRRLGNLPLFMRHLASVTEMTEKLSHWIAEGPGVGTLEWDAVIINEHPGELIAWRSLEGSDVDHAGSVRFQAITEEETEIKIAIEYRPPAGKLGQLMVRLFGSGLAQQIEEDLVYFKRLMEQESLLNAPHAASF